MSSSSPQQTFPTQEEIAVCAFLLWEKDGCPHGRDLIHWLQAEEQLLADFAQDAGMLGPDAAAQLELQKFHTKPKRKQKPVKAQ